MIYLTVIQKIMLSKRRICFLKILNELFIKKPDLINMLRKAFNTTDINNKCKESIYPSLFFNLYKLMSTS